VGEGPAIVIVPLESPPLSLGPGIKIEDVLAAHAGAAMSWSSSAAAAEAGRAMYVLSGIMILANLPAQSRVADRRAESAEALLNADDVATQTAQFLRSGRFGKPVAASA
jgi:hypothetical protein